MKKLPKFLGRVLEHKKRIISFITACATAFLYVPTNLTGTIASAVTTDSSDKPISIDGDVNTDTQTNYIDLLLLKKHILSVNNNTINGDINNDGIINILDILQLKNMLLSISTPIDENDIEKILLNDGNSNVDVENLFQTDKEYTVLTNIADNYSELKDISGTIYSEADSTIKDFSISIDDNGNWATDTISLDIGTNYITITYTYTDGSIVNEEYTIQRFSTEIQLADNVKLFTDDEVETICNSIITIWNDDMGTDDTFDDETNLLVAKDSILANSIENQDLVENDIIYIPNCKSFPMGLSLVYLYNDINYDSSTYGSDCVVIHTQKADIFQVLNEDDVFFNYDNIDIDSITWIPYEYDDNLINERYNSTYTDGNEPITISDEYDDLTEIENVELLSKSPMTFNTVGESQDDLKQGWNLSNLISESTIKIDISTKDSIEETLKSLNVTIGSDDAIIYDNDGNKKTTHDQIKASLNVAFSDFSPQVLLEKHKNIAGSETDKVDQFLCKLNYSREINVGMSGDVAFDFSKLLSDKIFANNNNDDNNVFELYGIDMEDKLVLGMISLDLSTKVPTQLLLCRGNDSLTYTPSIFVMVYMDVTGKISAKLSVGWNYKSMETIGFNLQNLDYTDGKYGSYYDLKSANPDCNLEASGYGCTFYNGSDSKTLSNKITVKPEGALDIGVGLNLGAGFSIINIVPVFANVGVSSNLNASGNFDIGYDIAENEFIGYPSKEFDLDLTAKGNFNSMLEIKFGIKTLLGNRELDIKIPGYDKELFNIHLESIKWDLNKTTGVLTISGTGDMEDYNYGSNAPWYDDKDYIKKVVIKDGITSIGCSAFEDCTSLENIIIPNSVSSIDYWAFGGCTSLESVTIPDSVTEIEGWVFCDCTSLESITIPNSVTSIDDGAFSGCTSLKNVTIGNSVTYIGDGAFSSCTSLIEINVDNENKYYFSEDGILFNKDKTELICYPSNKVGSSYTIPNSVTSIKHSAFENCKSLEGIIIPDGITSIENDVFSNCTSLESIIIPNSVTSIGWSAFSNCTSLKSITIPSSVTFIGNYAFYHCESLTDVYYTGTEEEWNAIDIASVNGNLISATIHYNS